MMTERLDELKKLYESQMEVLEEMRQKLGKYNQDHFELMKPGQIAKQIFRWEQDWIGEYHKTGREAPEEINFIETCIFNLKELLNRYESDIDPWTYELKGGIAKTTDPPPVATDPSPHSKINWQGTQTQLVYLWDELFAMGLVNPMEENYKWQMLAEHFVVKGKPLKSENLKKACYNLELNEPDHLPTQGKPIKSLLKKTESLGD